MITCRREYSRNRWLGTSGQKQVSLTPHVDYTPTGYTTGERKPILYNFSQISIEIILSPGREAKYLS